MIKIKSEVNKTKYEKSNLIISEVLRKIMPWSYAYIHVERITPKMFKHKTRTNKNHMFHVENYQKHIKYRNNKTPPPPFFHYR